MSILDTTTEQRRKKLALLERARRYYVQAVYSYLPCLSMPDEAGIAHEAIKLIRAIAEWHEVALIGNSPKTPGEQSCAIVAQEIDGEPLTNAERKELSLLVSQHGIYIARDPDTQEMTMTHSTINGAFHPLNEREVLDVARDIARQAGGIV